MFAGFTHRPAVDLATALAGVLPGELSHVFYSDDGSTSVEVALKMAYQYWANRGEGKRRVFISFDGGYHGDTLGAMSVGRGSGFFTLYRNLMCQVAVLPFPYTFDGDEAAEGRERGALTALEERLWNGAQDIAALIVEPLLQGAGGMRMCRPEFLKSLVDIARAAGILVIFDEVATGFGRTGSMFAMQQAGIAPDIVCLSKGLTSGYMPMAATVANDKVHEAFLGETFDKALPHGHSFTANPLACAVALASLGLFEEEATLERIARIEERHREMLSALRAREDVIRPRVLGTVLAFDLKGDGGYQSARSQSLKSWFLAKGLNIRPLGATVYLLPPYCITDAELNRAYAGLMEGLDWLKAQS
jgi:adenosylmethionine-8-amino-7-oxononanoate aminotransferase